MKCLDVSTSSSYEFTKGIHSIVNVNMDNIKYKYPSIFINSFREDEAVSVSYYYRYHDFIAVNKSDKYLSKTMNMIKIYRDLNRQYLLRSHKNIEKVNEEMKLRKNLSIAIAILNSLPIGQELTYDNIISEACNEMLNELYLRIEWEESKLLSIIKCFRSGITNDIKTWSEKYTKYENESREKWYKCLCLSVKSLFNRLAVYLEQSDADKLRNVDMDKLSLTIDNHKIYEEGKYDYLFNVNIDKITMVDGLWKLVEDNNYITTARKLLVPQYLSFKEIKPSPDTNMSEVKCLKEKITPVSPAFNSINNIMREQDGDHKKQLRWELLSNKLEFGVCNINVNIYDEIITNENNKLVNKKSARDTARNINFVKSTAYDSINDNNSNNINKQLTHDINKNVNIVKTSANNLANNNDKQSAREIAREKYFARSSAYGSVISNNSNNSNNDNLVDVKKYSRVKISRDQKREDSMNKYLKECRQVYKMLPPDESDNFVLDKDDLHKFEPVTTNQLESYRIHFNFNHYKYAKGIYIPIRAHKTINSVYGICKKYELTIDEFMYRFTSKVAKNSVGNNDYMYQLVFDKFNRINCDYESLHLFDIKSLHEEKRKRK